MQQTVMPAVLTTTLVAAPPAPRPLKRRALPVPSRGTQQSARRKGGTSAPAGLRTSTTTFTPGDTIKAADQGRRSALGTGRRRGTRASCSASDVALPEGEPHPACSRQGAAHAAR